MESINLYVIFGFFLTLITLIISIKTDLKNNIIKNKVLLISSLMGIVLSILNNNNLLLQLFVCVLFFFILFAVPRKLGINEFLGAGDIKLYMTLILIMGSKFGLYSFIYSILIGCFFLLLLNLKRIKKVFLNVSMFFCMEKKITSSIIDNQKVNIFSPYILIGFLITFFQIYIMENNWLFESICFLK